MTAVGKSQRCEKFHHLKIQCSLVPAGGQQGPKRKAELDMDETAQPKWLKLIIEVSGMRLEPMTQEVLFEHSALLRDVRGLSKSQLEELKGLRRAVAAMGSVMDDIVKRMSRMEEGSRSGNEGHGVYRRWEKKKEM